MAKYEIKTSNSPYTIEYSFGSIEQAKKFFCDEILNMSYDSKDDFSKSSLYFEEMGTLLALYSKDKCYAIKSFAESISDFKKWGASEYSPIGKTNRESLGEDYFLNIVNQKCEPLLEQLKLYAKDNVNILMPSLCCEAAGESAEFSCDRKVNYYEFLSQAIGCDKYEGLCE